MTSGVQKVLASIGGAGCYALSIVQAARPNITDGEAVQIIEAACNRGFIHYDDANRNDENMLVLDAGAVFSLARDDGTKWNKRFESVGYKPKPGEYVVEQWKRGDISHFKLENFDPYGDSLTVRKGKLVSYRVFSRA